MHHPTQKQAHRFFSYTKQREETNQEELAAKNVALVG